MKFIPSPRMFVAGLITAFVAIWLSNNVATVKRIVGPRVTG